MYQRVVRSLISIPPSPALSRGQPVAGGPDPVAGGPDPAASGRSPRGTRAAALVVVAAGLGVAALMLCAGRPDAATQPTEDAPYPPKLMVLLRAF
jgi:hypothetical protein